MKTRDILRWLPLIIGCTFVSANGDDPAVQFVGSSGSLEITIGDRPWATYVYDGKQIPRPYFANVFVPGGPKITRSHPPIAGTDDMDHGVAGDYFHPGIWLAFSDLNGNDYWRLKARVQHEAFLQQPTFVDG